MQDNTISEDSDRSRPTLGQLLRQARLEQHLDRSDIAGRLHLNADIIEAIERDKPLDNVSNTYARGYIRSFARAVGVDDTLLPGHFETMGLNEPVVERSSIFINSPIHMRASSKPQLIRWFSVFVVLLLIAMVAFWWRGQERQSSSKLVLAPTSATPVKVDLPAQSNVTKLSPTYHVEDVHLDKK